MSKFEIVETGMIERILADNIRDVAKRREISLNRLADLSGVSRSQLYNVLAGGTSASISWITRVATTLEVEPWQLIKPGQIRLPTRRR